MSPNGATQSRQGKQWQLHSGSVPVVVHAIPRLYVVRLELALFVECRINTNTRTYSHP